MIAHPRSKHAAAKIACVVLVLLSIGPSQAARTTTMGLDEGSPASTTCPNKKYLAGFAIQHDTTMSGLQPYCVDMANDGTWSGGAQIYLDAVMSAPRPEGKRLDLFCPRDFYAVGFRGYSHVYGVHSILQLTITCKNIQTGTLYEIATPPPGAAVTEWRGARCSDDSVAEGVFGRINSGGYIAQFGLTCTQTRPVLLLLRDQARLTRGAREQATVTKVPPPVRAASAETAAVTSAVRAAPLIGGSAMQPATAATPAQSPSQFPAATRNSALPDMVKRADAPAMTRVMPSTSSPIGEPVSAPKLQAANARSQRLTVPPEIVAPAPDSLFPKGKFSVQVRAPTAGAGGSAEVEFIWVKAGPPLPVVGSPTSVTTQRSPDQGAPMAPPPPIVWHVSMVELVRGAAVPVSARPNWPGIWRVRVRSIGGPVPGDWSEPVHFALGGFFGIEPDAAALNPQPLPPKTSPSLAQQPPRTRDWKQAPSTFNR